MLRDVLGHRIRRQCYFEFANEMEKYYIYNNNAYQIIRMSKHYKLDGMYVDILIRNIDTNKVSSIFIPYKTFKEKKLFKKRPRKSLYIKRRRLK